MPPSLRKKETKKEKTKPERKEELERNKETYKSVGRTVFALRRAFLGQSSSPKSDLRLGIR